MSVVEMADERERLPKKCLDGGRMGERRPKKCLDSGWMGERRPKKCLDD